MKIERRFTKPDVDVYSQFEWSTRTSRITNPDGSVVFEMKDAQIPKKWSQLATDIMVSKYFRKAGVPVKNGQLGVGSGTKKDASSLSTPDSPLPTTSEKSARQVIHRLAGCWTALGRGRTAISTPPKSDAVAFYDELCLHDAQPGSARPTARSGSTPACTSPTASPARLRGHYYCDPKTGELKESSNAYEHPQPHACFIQSVSDDLVNEGGIMDLWTREARLFKYGSGTGSRTSATCAATTKNFPAAAARRA